MNQGEQSFDVMSVSGENKKTVSVEGGFGDTNYYAMTDQGFYFWDKEGVVQIDLQGYRHVIAERKDVEALDYKQLPQFSRFSVMKNDRLHTYDPMKKDIRVFSERLRV